MFLRFSLDRNSEISVCACLTGQIFGYLFVFLLKSVWLNFPFFADSIFFPLLFYYCFYSIRPFLNNNKHSIMSEKVYICLFFTIFYGFFFLLFSRLCVRALSLFNYLLLLVTFYCNFHTVSSTVLEKYLQFSLF